MELLSGGSAADANAMAATVLVEKVMSELAVSADDVAKFVRLQKAMYDSGATPQVRLGFYTTGNRALRHITDLGWVNVGLGCSPISPICSTISARIPFIRKIIQLPNKSKSKST